jgi:hypothetical protein
MTFIESMNTPETWRWAIGTAITVLSIFGAAYFAQKVFNKNARIREDRERRLLGLEEILTITHELAALLNDMGKSIEQIDNSWNKMILAILKAHSINTLLGFELNKSINRVENVVKQLGYYLEDNLDKCRTDEDEPFHAVSKEIRASFISSITTLTNEIVVTFNSTEKKH